MRQHAYRVFLRTVFSLCIVVLGLSSLPHHHHDGSESVCFNLKHCFSATADCSEAHEHCTDSDGSEPSSCHLKIDVAEVLASLSKHLVLPPAVFEVSDLLVVRDEMVDDPALTAADRAFSDKPNPGAVVITYIARALPVRASSHIC